MGSRTDPTVPDRATSEFRAAGRAAERPQPRNLAPVCLVLDLADRGAGITLRAREDVQGPDRFLTPATRPAAAQQSGGRGQIFGLQEELGKSRMCLVAAAIVEGHLDVARHLQRTGSSAVVGQRDPPDLGIRVSHDRDLVTRLDVRIAALEDSPARTEARLIVVGVCAERLPTGRPGAAAIEITDVAVLAPAVASRVLAPARHVQPIVGAVSAPGLRQHDAIAAVRQQADVRGRGVGCSPAALALGRVGFRLSGRPSRRLTHGDS